MTTLLISVKPMYAHRLLSGKKHVEYRRVRPKVQAGDRAIIYSTSPEMAVVGGFTISDVMQGKPAAIWKRSRRKSGLSKSEYATYFQGAGQAVGLVVDACWRLAKPVSLTTLKRRVKDFRPPQSYCYLSTNEAQRLCR